MATVSDDIIYARETLTGGPPPILWFPEGASQTFVKGELLKFSSGVAVELTDGDDTNITTNPILGVAMADGHNAASGAYSVPVALAVPWVIFEANLKQVGGANHTSAQADMGLRVAVLHDTTVSKVFLNVSTSGASTSCRAKTLTPGRSSAIGDINARTLFTFLPEACDITQVIGSIE